MPGAVGGHRAARVRGCSVATMSDDTRDALEGIERRGWQALCEGDAAAFYDSLMTTDGAMVLADGRVMTRDEAVRALRGSPTWDDYEIREVRLVTTGDASAALVYRATARREGQPDLVARMTSTYLRLRGQWRLALYTQTPLTGPTA